MNPNTNIKIDKIKFYTPIKTDKISEIAPITDGLASLKVAEETNKKTFEINIPSEVSVSLIPTYKKFYIKRKGKRYLHYYKLKVGFDPRIINELLKGGL